jgi:protein phosphatase
MTGETKLRAVFSGASDTGRWREHNEDAWLADAKSNLFLVADGMGGAEAGEVASAMAVEEVSRLAGSTGDLVSAVESAHKAILSGPDRGQGSKGMGSTIVALRILENRYEIAWLGDSRIYRLHNRNLQLLSRDHSLVQDLIDQGEITEDEAKVHPHRHIITRVLGGSRQIPPQVDWQQGLVNEFDRFLLCSDGLNGELDEEVIRALLEEADGPHAAVHSLIGAAVRAGGRDNITALVVELKSMPN